jgi:polar amino acid transport system substrate-binding protein
MKISPDIVAELAPTGVLRAGLNLSNFLLISARDADGGPVGVAPDMATAIAERLGVPVRYVSYPKPGELADAAGTDAWDIGLIGAEPARAEKIEFTPAYVEIQSTYLVPANSPLRTIVDVDQPGIRIASTSRTAYGLWLDRNIQHAEIVHSENMDATFELFQRDGLDALSGLRPRLMTDLARLPGARILDGQFAAVQQAIGTLRKNEAGARFLREFAAHAIASGLVARLIAKHGVQGLSVAPGFTL